MEEICSQIEAGTPRESAWNGDRTTSDFHEIETGLDGIPVDMAHPHRKQVVAFQVFWELFQGGIVYHMVLRGGHHRSLQRLVYKSLCPRCHHPDTGNACLRAQRVTVSTTFTCEGAASLFGICM